MGFETTKDVYDWYERQQPVFTKEGIERIPWSDVRKYPLDERFIPVLLYIRDVETLTDMYHRELLRTPTCKDPYIGRFMERWGVEEVIHGITLLLPDSAEMSEQPGLRVDEEHALPGAATVRGLENAAFFVRSPFST